jgi:putative photosynthetic complex assembly protein 2
MSLFLAAVAFAIFSWWFSTGLVLFLNHLADKSYRWSLAAVTAILVGCLVTLPITSQMATVTGAFLGFTQALLIWSWLEMTYFMGFLTGPRHTPCPPDARGWMRFGYAVQTSVHHELAVIALGVLVVSIVWETPNPVAGATYAVLWIMRWSAKLNLFFGVANVNSDWFPKQLRYLTTYIGKRSINAFFPVAVTLATIALTMVVMAAFEATSAFETTALTLVATLLGLALLEHWFLVLPLRDSMLWQWCLELAREARARRHPDPLRRHRRSASGLYVRRESNDCL